MSHEVVEKNVGLMMVMIVLVISVAGLVQIVPLYFLQAMSDHGSTTQPVKGLKPYTPLQLEGRDIYVREGCYNCHSQMIRPFRAETERYGHYSVVGEFVYDHPFQWGSKRTGPDLARVGGRYSDDWHRYHLTDPRSVVPESNMPAYPWLGETPLDIDGTADKMRVMNHLIAMSCSGCETYTDAEIEGAAATLKDAKGQPKTELDAVIAYLQHLGTSFKPGH